MVHDIRGNIPLTDFTNAAKYPEYEYREFPKMMLQEATKEYVSAWLERNSVPGDNGKTVYPGARPRMNSLVPVLDDNFAAVVAHDPEEEEELRERYPQCVKTPNTHAQYAQVAETQRENEELRAQLAEMQARLDNKALKAAVEEKPAASADTVTTELPKPLKTAAKK